MWLHFFLSETGFDIPTLKRYFTRARAVETVEITQLFRSLSKLMHQKFQMQKLDAR